jgi:adenine deaminase
MSRQAKPGNKPQAWTESAPLLVDVAMGRKPADLVVRNGRWVSVYSGEIIAGTDIAIAGGRFAYCGPNASHAIGQGTKVVDAAGAIWCPASATRICMSKAAW